MRASSPGPVDAAPATIRAAQQLDAELIARIYAPYVLETAISFELEPPSAEEIVRRMRAHGPGYPWLVAELEGTTCGYAYASPFRARPAYRFSVEVTVYVDASKRGHGIGRALYAALLPDLAARGYARAIAGITLPNAASVALHEAMGFEPAGVFRRVGYKRVSESDGDAWHDVGFWQRDLS
ncbi:MAG: arsinothricin resistance N-acetyltransferase ArsN1 family B [Polyangiaceae bacterium]